MTYYYFVISKNGTVKASRIFLNEKRAEKWRAKKTAKGWKIEDNYKIIRHCGFYSSETR